MTDGRSAITRWWNGWYVAFVAFIGGYAIYVIFVLGRMSQGETETASPRTLNIIALITLALGAILSYLAAGRLSRRRREGAFQAAVLTAVTAPRPRRVGADEPTVPMAARSAVYLAATTVQGAVEAAVLRRVDQHIDSRLADLGKLADTEQEMAGAGGWPDGVSPMPRTRR